MIISLTYLTDDAMADFAALAADRDKLEADALEVDDWINRARHIGTKADLLALRTKLSRAIRENTTAIVRAQRAMYRRAVA